MVEGSKKPTYPFDQKQEKGVLTNWYWFDVLERFYSGKGLYVLAKSSDYITFVPTGASLFWHRQQALRL